MIKENVGLTSLHKIFVIPYPFYGRGWVGPISGGRGCLWVSPEEGGYVQGVGTHPLDMGPQDDGYVQGGGFYL